MSNNNITYQNNNSYANGYTYNNNPIYRDIIKRDTIKRDTIYEEVKVNNPIVLKSKETNSYIQNINYDNNNNLYSEYPVSNNNIITNNNNSRISKYFNQPTPKLASENNLENYFNGTYANKVINITQNNNNLNNAYTYDNSNNNIISGYNEYNEYSSTKIIQNGNDYNPPIIAKTPLRSIKKQIKQVLPPKTIEYGQIKKLQENVEPNYINISPNININNLGITKNPIKQISIQENEIAQVKKIIEENGENTNVIKKIVEEENKPVIPPKINEEAKKVEIKNLPGPAKINKISSQYFPYNPRVRFAKQEKINIVKLADNNNQIENNKPPLIKKEENNKNGLYEGKNIITKINDDKAIIPKKEVLSNQKPDDDFESYSKRNKNGFHNVRISKKDPSNELFVHSKLLDLGDYNDFYKEGNDINQRPRAKITVLNYNKKNIFPEKNKNPFTFVKKIEKKINNEKTNPFFRTFPDEGNKDLNNDFNSNNRYNTKNEEDEEEQEEKEEEKEEEEKEENDLNYDKHNSDIVDNNFEFIDNEEKNYDNINNRNLDKDTEIKPQKNSDELDEFDNDFNEHDKFYKKMKNIFDE